MRRLVVVVFACVGCGSSTPSSSDAGDADCCASDGPIAVDSGVDAANDARPKSYSTDFLGVENPISENGVWTNGGVVGLMWQDVRKQNGFAVGSGPSAGYDDCIAHLSGFPANHFA